MNMKCCCCHVAAAAAAAAAAPAAAAANAGDTTNSGNHHQPVNHPWAKYTVSLPLGIGASFCQRLDALPRDLETSSAVYS